MLGYGDDMTNDISISETELNIIINEMNSESLEMFKCLESLSNLFDSLNQSLEGEIADSIKSKFESIEADFPIIKSNIESYSTDLKNLITKFNVQDSSISLKEVDLAKGGEIINVKN